MNYLKIILIWRRNKLKIYLGESLNFMGYTLIGDLGQEYATHIYPKSKNIENVQQKCLEMCLCWIQANRPIYTKQSPEIYIVKENLKSQDIIELNHVVYKSLFFHKYKNDTGNSIIFKKLKEYSEKDTEFLKVLHSALAIKERDLSIFNNKILSIVKVK